MGIARALVAVALLLVAGLAHACDGVGRRALSDFPDRQLQQRLGVMLADTSAHFGVGFARVCVSDTLFHARADVLRRELTLGRRILTYYGARPNGAASLAAILAHETAHQFQYDSGWMAGRTDSLAALRCLELHADFMAGGYARHAYATRHGATEPASVARYFDEDHGPSLFYGILGGRSARAAEAHGTPGERLRAFRGGFDRLRGGWTMVGAALGCAA